MTLDGESIRRGILVDHDPASSSRRPHLTLVGVTLRNGNAPTELLVNTLSSFGGALDAFQASVLMLDVKVIDNIAQGLNSNTLPGDGSGAFRGGLGGGGAIFAFESTVTRNDAIAIRSDGIAFAVRGATSAEFWRFDVQGGSAQLVQANIGQPLDGLAFDSSDTLFGLSENLSLFEVNTLDGTLTLVGNTGLSGPATAGLAFSASGSLRAAIGNQLFSIDSATAVPTSLGPIGTSPFTTAAVSGLVFVPEPRQPLLTGAALLVLLVLMGVRKRQPVGVEAR